ncbi:MAG: HDOD domain-containing protein [Acidimicrobiia bacterium]
MVTTTTVSVHRMVAELQSLPTRPTVALRVVMAANDPNSSAETLGRLIEIDPSLSAQVMRLANSAYYGLTHRVASANRAAAVIGIGTARALAASTATGLVGADRAPTPMGFWEHSVAAAVAASVVAPKVGANASEAFTLGLLHDVGRALLYRCEPSAYGALVTRVINGDVDLIEAERATFGIDHAEVAASVLAEWKFPEPFVDAIARHHAGGTGELTPLRRALAAGEELAFCVGPPEDHAVESRDWPAGHGLALAGLTPDDAQRLGTAVQNGTAELLASLSS